MKALTQRHVFPMPVLLAGLALAACGSDGVASEDSGSVDGDAQAGSDSGAVDGGTHAGSDSGGSPGPISEADYPQVVARAWCELLFECGCAELDANVDSCVERVAGQVERKGETYRSMGLTYDDRCPAAVLREITLRGCSGFPWPVEVGCAACPFYNGDLPQGDGCTPIEVSFATTCAQGLFCLPAEPGADLTCEEPCEVNGRFVGEGQACDPDANVYCDALNASCGPSGTCEAFPGLGEPCPRNQCSGESYCDSSSDTCVEFKGRGDACTDGTECDTAFCDDGVCASFCWLRPF